MFPSTALVTISGCLFHSNGPLLNVLVIYQFGYFPSIRCKLRSVGLVSAEAAAVGPGGEEWGDRLEGDLHWTEEKGRIKQTKHSPN